MVKDLLKGDNHTCMNNPTNQIKFKKRSKNADQSETIIIEKSF